MSAVCTLFRKIHRNPESLVRQCPVPPRQPLAKLCSSSSCKRFMPLSINSKNLVSTSNFHPSRIAIKGKNPSTRLRRCDKSVRLLASLRFVKQCLYQPKSCSTSDLHRTAKPTTHQTILSVRLEIHDNFALRLVWMLRRRPVFGGVYRLVEV